MDLIRTHLMQIIPAIMFAILAVGIVRQEFKRPIGKRKKDWDL